MLTKNLPIEPDKLGAFSSSLCLVHCIATPFIFIAHSCSASCCAAGPVWWRAIDFLFLAVSFAAIYWTAKTTAKNWIKYALWVSWVALFLVIANEYVGLFPIAKAVSYVPAMSLVVLHLYNRRYCKCAEDTCCVEGGTV